MSTHLAAKPSRAENPEREQFLDDVLDGLSGPKKQLNPKYFYDAAGSKLFDRITRLPEYYITRTETQMMKDLAGSIGAACSDTEVIIEFGSGSGQRSELLLESLPQAHIYVPIDVSDEQLAATARVVTQAHPQITVQPLVGDFTDDIRVPAALSSRRLGYFPGSTIGNFPPQEAVRFLANARQLLGPQARMLIGVDLLKPFDVLERAYNDQKGVTAEFNLNVLHRINSELDATFDVNQFAHWAFFNERQSRIEMHLVSLKDQKVTVDRTQRFSFREGETIHTENSYKYSLEHFRELAQEAGWRPSRFWTDDKQLFSLHLLEHA